MTSRSDGLTMTYDANGNMVTKGPQALAYDAENRLVKVSGTGPVPDTEFVYDGDGGRVQKIAGANTTTYVGKLYEKKPDGTFVKYIWLGSTRICSKSSTGTKLFYHANHLGSTDLVTDAVGTEVTHYEYTPWGEIFSSSGTVSTPYRYTGKELDSETGFYFYEARYYDPQLGRFITPDTIVPNFSNPQDFNRYTYASNNPLIYTDPTGHFSFKKFFKKIWQAVVAVGAIAAAPFTAGQSLWALAGLTVYNGAQAIQNGQFGAFMAGLAVSAILGYAIPMPSFGNLFMQVGVGALRGAAFGAIAGGIGSVAAGGSFGAGAAAGAAGGAIGGGVSAFFTSQQFTNWRANKGFVSNATLSAKAESALNVNTGGKTHRVEMYKRSVARDKFGFEQEHPLVRSDGTYTEIEAVRLSDGSTVKQVFHGPLSAMSQATQDYMAQNPLPDRIYSVDTETFTNSLANYTEANYGKPYNVDTFGRIDGKYTDSRALIDILDRSEAY